MQNVHELSQPIWIVTHAECRDSRRAGSAPVSPPAQAPPVDGSCSSAISTIGRPVAPGRVEQRGRPAEVVGAEHDVDVPGPLDDQVAVLLGEAAADRDLQVGVGVLQGLEPAEVAVELVVGVLADAAGVEDDDVGVVDASRSASSPSATSSPATRSESCSFIWQP